MEDWGNLGPNQAVREEGLNKSSWGWAVGDLGEGCTPESLRYQAARLTSG